MYINYLNFKNALPKCKKSIYAFLAKFHGIVFIIIFKIVDELKEILFFIYLYLHTAKILLVLQKYEII